ncbi:MAG TPA: hypothetical protein VJR29_12140 [bacterium]|nr:hypothetical protein [bacterium]
MRKLALFFALAWMFSAALPHSSFAEEDSKARSQETVKQDAEDDKPVGGESGKKGGIYVVGRGFKTAGSEMEKGFKAAGRGIVKGGKATGRGFKKAGGAIKGFFTGESGDDKKEEEKK